MQPRFATLVGSRICHDLISPIGAIGNGLELLSLTDGDPSAEMTLITDSLQSANARIKFYRIAYGAAAKGQMLAASEVLSFISTLARGGRFTYFWQVTETRQRCEVRCALVMLQCLETAMPTGGDIHIRLFGDTWELSAESLNFRVDPCLWDGLGQPEQAYPFSAAQVQFALLPQFLIEAGRQVHAKISADRITLRF
jgi:histidine phosphotransferase ChpT